MCFGDKRNILKVIYKVILVVYEIRLTVINDLCQKSNSYSGACRSKYLRMTKNADLTIPTTKILF